MSSRNKREDDDDSLEEAPSRETIGAVQDLEVSESGRVLVHTKSSDDCCSDDGTDNAPDGTTATGEAPKPKPTAASDLSNPQRRIWVVTTAGLPWRTGTAVNPLLRALALTHGRPKHYVTLMIPWLPDAQHRRKLYGAADSLLIQTQSDQEDWIRKYIRERCGYDQHGEANLRIHFYEGSYQDSFGSIFPASDICSLIPLEEADVAILEEPEHLNWFRVPKFEDDVDEKVILGWAHMFRHVVGILHTNYAEYVREYSMGASLVTAPALNSLSSLVVRAYCHQVIRLSATLPSLCDKEVTSNVHGVRPEFLEDPKPDADRDTQALAPVYFIGKVIWAKGFDKVLELQERFKDETGDYFKMDVYGTGNDESAIQRAFFGRKGSANNSATSTPVMSDDEGRDSPKKSSYAPLPADIFGKTESLRAILDTDNLGIAQHDAHNNNAESTDDDSDATSNADNDETPYGSDTEGATPEGETESANASETADAAAPENTVLSILSDASGKAISTGFETAGATAALIESAMAAVFSRKAKRSKQSPSKKKTSHLNIVPLRARFKWRSTALPARFLGTKDHSLIRDIPEHTIFLNMSTTEVLCTTSAEALAMGKYVILPKHPSNEFFYKFPNCLAYDDLDDCVSKIQYALTNRAEYLTEKHVFMLSWKGATERLFKAAAITEAEEARRNESGMIAADLKAARFHVDSASKSQMVKKMISGGGLLSKKSSSASIEEESEAAPPAESPKSSI